MKITICGSIAFQNEILSLKEKLEKMGLAFFLKKKIYLLNEVPEISYKEEILGMKPIILNGDLSKISGFQAY